jgi:uncharacterized membrane protein YccC
VRSHDSSSSIVSRARSLQAISSPFQLALARPAIEHGLRGALGVWVPIGLGLAFGDLRFGVLAGFAAVNVLSADAGGAYRTKAIALSSATVGIALAVFVATLTNPYPWARVLVMFLWAFGAGLAALYGNAASVVSFITAIVLATAVDLPNPPDAGQRVLLYLAGGLWAMILSLALWPLQTHTPIFRALTNIYQRLALFLESGVRHVAEQGALAEASREAFTQMYDALVVQIDAARSTWADTRAQRSGASRRGIQLLILIESAAQMANAIVTIVELFDAATAHPSLSDIRAQFVELSRQLRDALRSLAIVISKRGGSNADLSALTGTLDSIDSKLALLRRYIRGVSVEGFDADNIHKLLTRVELFTQKVHRDAEIAATLSGTVNVEPLDSDFIREIVREHPPIWGTLRDNFNFRSLGFRHAVRMGIIAALASALTLLLQMPRGYWAVLTVLVVLKPNFGGTLAIVIQRIAGTVLGGLIAVILGAFIHDQVALLFCAGLLAFAAFSLRPLNYSLFVLALTPMVVLILNLSNIGDWWIALLRVFETLLGGGLAVLGGCVLFPVWDRQQLRPRVARAIRSSRDYFLRASGLVRGDPVSNKTLDDAQHQAALDISNVVASAQRSLSEPGRSRQEIELVLTLGVYIRGFFNSVTALVDSVREMKDERLNYRLEELAREIEPVLSNLADVLKHRAPLNKLPESEERLITRSTEAPAVSRTLSDLIVERLAATVAVMHSTVERTEKEVGLLT